MAKTQIGDREVDFAALWAKHRRTIVGAAVAIAVVGGGTWYWTASQSLKETRGEAALGGAEQAFYSGNLQLAGTELQRMLARYSGTRAGVRATMLLAQTWYAGGEHAQGVEALRGIVGSRSAKPFRAPVNALIASGLENQGLFDEAAAAFGQAAATAITQFDRDLYEADQARALTSAGRQEQALAIWRRHAARESAATSSEARLRIGELTAVPAG